MYAGSSTYGSVPSAAPHAAGLLLSAPQVPGDAPAEESVLAAAARAARVRLCDRGADRDARARGGGERRAQDAHDHHAAGEQPGQTRLLRPLRAPDPPARTRTPSCLL